MKAVLIILCFCAAAMAASNTPGGENIPTLGFLEGLLVKYRESTVMNITQCLLIIFRSFTLWTSLSNKEDMKTE